MAFSNVLDYYAKINSSFLHGAGIMGTQHLLNAAQLQGTETLFELGSGTGASLVLLAHSFPKIQLHGGDVSSLMLAKAKKRIKISGFTKRVQLHQLLVDTPLPVPDQSMDVVWVESVLAIQETGSLRYLLLQISRILKPGGKLLLNETLWLPSTSKTERKHINQVCETQFGIIQANSEIADLEDWRQLLGDAGFTVDYQARVDDLSALAQKHAAKQHFCSKVFNLIGKLRRLLHPRIRRETQRLQRLEKEIMGQGEQKLSAYIIVAKLQE